MYLWHPTFDETKRLRHHATAPGFGHALLSPVVAHYFSILRVSATLWDNGEWFVLSTSPTPASFEDEHGVEGGRGPYNQKHFDKVHRTKKTILGEHAGFHDLFVPVVARGRVIAVLVVGPFLRERSTSSSVLSRWRALTGRQGHTLDPQFAAYLGATLGTLVLEADRFANFERLTACLARLLAGDGDAGALTSEAHALGAELEQVRIVERTWDAVRSMVDDRSARRWLSAYRAYGLRDLGLPRAADSVLVGLVAREAKRDPVDEAVRRDTLQRDTVHLARRHGDAIAGRVGDHGIVLLCTAAGKTRRLHDLAEQTAKAARQLGLSLHFGSSSAGAFQALSGAYQRALVAAESALSRGVRMEEADPRAKVVDVSLRGLRAELEPEAEKRPSLLPARFDRYLEAVATRCDYRPDAARGHLDAGFERIAEALVSRGAIDAKSYAAMCQNLDHATVAAKTLDDLFGAYRRAVLDLCDAVQKPVEARHERSVRGAIEYIRQHYAEPIQLADAARVAGLTPNYFAELFRKRERVTFLEYVTGLRVERSKQLLTGTPLPMTRVAELSGFHSPQYFARVFRRIVGRTPGAYRRRPGHR